MSERVPTPPIPPPTPHRDGHAPPGPGPQPVLRRPREGRAVLGVAVGLARYLGVDPVVVRVGFVLLAVFGGSGVLLYVVGALVIPVEEPGDVLGRATSMSRHDTGVAVGAVLVVAGMLALAGQLVPQASSLLGPAILLSAGTAVLVIASRR